MPRGLKTGWEAGCSHGGLHAARRAAWNPGFLTDPNCIAWYRYENSLGLHKDSKGGNDWTNAGASPNGNHKEAATSGHFDKTPGDWMTILDADLDAGFPFKSGDATKIISMAFWIYFKTLNNAEMIPQEWIWAKYRYDWPAGDGAPRFSWRVFVAYEGGIGGDPYLAVNKGYGALGANEEGAYPLLGAARVWLQPARWYHVGITYDDADTDSLNIRLWDDTAKTLVNDGNNATGIWSQNIHVTDTPVWQGARDYDAGIGHTQDRFLDAYVDEFVIFNDVLTNAQIDLIRQGKYKI